MVCTWRFVRVEEPDTPVVVGLKLDTDSRIGLAEILNNGTTLDRRATGVLIHSDDVGDGTSPIRCNLVRRTKRKTTRRICEYQAIKNLLSINRVSVALLGVEPIQHEAGYSI